jgi:outer membrane lipoprotein-sorting protein
MGPTCKRLLPVTVLAAWTAAAAQGPDPWSLLSGVRDSLVDSGATAARFVQTYVPAGFDSGDSESGELALALPDCLRFDYEAPEPKSFLICGETAHFWNRDDKTGRRYTVDRREEPGLDLILLGLDQLKERYRATQGQAAAGSLEVTLTPRQEQAELASATLVIDTASRRVTALSYSDGEGNRTRFEITGYRPLRRGSRFDPPAGITWREGS